MRPLAKKKRQKMFVVLAKDTRVEYETEGGQHTFAVLPKGTKLRIPSLWIYMGVPDEDREEEKK